ncbi:MAG: flagellar assembly peptidoglycan hydrolase FlgJ, partial [Pseudomonadota bacterium]
HALDANQANAVVEQFEKMFVRMMLKSMRSATATLNPGGGLGGAGALGGAARSNSSYLEMFDGEIAGRLVQGRGLGVADLLREQLGLTGARNAEAASTTSRPLPGRREFADRQMPPAADPRFQRTPRPAQRALVPATPLAGTSAVPARRESAHFASARDFVAGLLPLARQAATRLGVSARGLLAQMALETGWGQRIPPNGDGESSNNLFGIKAGSTWSGERTTLSTLEMEDGVVRRTTAQFRVYDSLEHSLDDYVRLLRENPRYTQALGTGENVSDFAHALQAGGYATDPAYAQKIESIAGGKLTELLHQIGAQP